MREQASEFVFARQRQIVQAWLVRRPSRQNAPRRIKRRQFQQSLFRWARCKLTPNAREERQGEALFALGGPE
jgi:hypothetical protein